MSLGVEKSTTRSSELQRRKIFDINHLEFRIYLAYDVISATHIFQSI
jgi:hypothetical protein